MGFRFRKSIKLLPGIKLNISKKGIGTSVGVKGFHVSNGPSGSRMTTSIPGTGLSHSTNLSGKKGRSSRSSSNTNSSRSEFIPGIQTPVVPKGPYYLKPWRAILGILFLLTTFSVFASDLKLSDILIAFLIFFGLTVLLLLPWIRWIFFTIKEIYTRNDNLPENQATQYPTSPPDPPDAL